MQKLIIKNKYLRYLLILLFSLALALIVRNLSFNQVLAFSANGSVNPLHYLKRACSNANSNQASCLAYVVTNLNGTPMSIPLSVVGNLSPTQFHQAYNLPCTPNGAVQSICSTPTTFGPETIAIVDAGSFDNSGGTIDESLDGYDSYYGLPSCTESNGCLTIVNQSGQTSSLPANVSAGWNDEIALDVETAHMTCQTCKILLVEANTAGVADLAASEVTASSFNPVAISNSYGSTTEEPSYNSDYTHTGMAIVAGSGDSGASNISWPADLPNVVAASGTTLSLNPNNSWAGESVWSGSGGSCSTNPAPLWQTSLPNWVTAGCGSNRAYGDVSADADPNSGMAIYMATSSTSGSWYEIGGTSLSSPLIASSYALAGGVLSGNNAVSILYGSFNSSNSHDITSGNDCTSTITTNCTAGVGFDTPSGLGSPNGISGFVVQPATNLSLKVDNNNGTSVEVSWTPSANSLIGGYYIYRNGVNIATVTSGNSYIDNNLTPNTSYTYYVQAYDPFSNLANPTVSQNITTYLPADINEDGHVNLLDLSILASKYGQSGSSVGRADINGDGTVNLLDLSILASKYGSE